MCIRDSTGSLLVKASDTALHEIPANTEDWLNKKIKDIKPDEQFFYQYFSTKTGAIKSKKAVDKDVDAFNDESDLDEEEVWDALVKSRPDVEGDEEESDVEFSDEDFSDMSGFSDGESQAENNSENHGHAAVAENVSESDIDEQDLDEDKFDGEANEISDFDEEEAKLFHDNTEDELSSEEDVFYSAEDNDDDNQQPPRKKSKKSKKSKKQALRDLPTFASAEDYAQYLDSDDE